ncbi:hypothetical protein ABID56_001969 [Alkalibacillus flavidus]|uniref:Uncharacterized protein n=1 Tax=Alkalibacillus flavidus TaxID=546021 RepID=A0ABV2KWW0_9BACI
MAEEKAYSITECSWCLEAIEVRESVYELEGNIILHESCYNSLQRYCKR